MISGDDVFLLGVSLAASAGSVIVLAGYAAIFALLVIPGLAAARALVRRFGFHPATTATLAFAVTAFAGYAVFWCYFLSPVAGKLASALWLVSFVVALMVLRRARVSRDEAIPLALAFLAGLFYLAALYLPAVGIDAGHRFFVMRPGDNLLPQLVAERMYHGQDLHHFLGDWLSSDRPPLQSGIILLVRPVFRALGAYADAGFEIAGIVAQLVWVPSAWLLCVRAGFSPRRRALVMAFLIFSGFFLYNTVYTWPKLLASGLCVAAFVCALRWERENRDAALVVAGVCAALALLAHGSA
ncbi:MAG TPA: hypothetical protein VK665_00750, partial [Candidatus Elarobacter sp.]|nr:hypothetical protein [Candidatus Elarobacter sp.]